jgi:4-hydroxy-3-methylbut-2-enyl diphosphate reductase
MAYGETFRPLQEGAVVTGTVVHIDREGVLVDVGTKSDGLIPPNELARDPNQSADLKVGQKVDVYVMDVDDQEGNLILSKKRADFEKAWDRVIEAHQEGRTIHAMVTDRVKGGLVVDLGIRGFVPASHVGSGKVRNLEKYVAQTLPLKVIEVDRDRRKVVLSHRLATEEEREAQRQETLGNLAEGQVRTGVVRRITDYGAFVDIGGVDGLLHISEMSWTRIKHPSDVLKVQDEIQVMVLKTNLEQGRISLGLRQILPDPWTEARERYNPGDTVQGAVTRLVPFGAFVQLDGGIEGIIPNSELSTRRVNKPEEVLQVGDHVEAKVLDIRPEERRMTLSLRQAQQQKERRELQEFNRGRPAEEDRVTIGDMVGNLLEPEPEEYEDEEEE